MRKFNVVIAALVVSGCGTAFAAATGTTTVDNTTQQSLTVTNDGVDSLAVSGTGFSNLSFTNVATTGKVVFGSGFKPAGGVTLTYSTQNESVNGPRQIAVSWAFTGIGTAAPATKIPANVTLRITAGDGTLNDKVVSLSNATNAFSNLLLIDGIAKYTNGGTKAVTYGVEATSGFDSFAGTLTYTIGNGF